MAQRYAGSEWLRANGNEVGEFGARVADLLGTLYYGLYHVDSGAIARCNWKSEHHIEIIVWQHGFSTWDYNELTRFVVLCHDACVRGEIQAARNGYFRLMFHPREREGGMSQRHPTMEDHLAKIRAEASNG